jgi:hypothetical protein
MMSVTCIVSVVTVVSVTSSVTFNSGSIGLDQLESMLNKLGVAPMKVGKQ